MYHRDFPSHAPPLNRSNAKTCAPFRQKRQRVGGKTAGRTLQGSACRGVRVPPCKNVGFSGADSRVRRPNAVYLQGLHTVQRLSERGAAEGKRGHEGRCVFTTRPPRRPVSSPRLSRPLPASQPRRQGRREAGARFYDDHGEGQGGAYVHHDDISKMSGLEPGGGEGDITFSHHSLLDPCVPGVRAECDLRPIREATPLM